MSALILPPFFFFFFKPQTTQQGQALHFLQRWYLGSAVGVSGDFTSKELEGSFEDCWVVHTFLCVRVGGGTSLLKLDLTQVKLSAGAELAPFSPLFLETAVGS